jgi:alkanesulfonate monooxygenase SsuD/methylene tetrahydromethanopterin reductase-like flavin-dependent oxidoreductase (luciferase family)
MRFAHWPNLTQRWADALALARHADATGWDGVYSADHFMGDGIEGLEEAGDLTLQRGLAYRRRALPSAYNGAP